MDNYTDNDARLLIAQFDNKDPYPDDDIAKIIKWGQRLVAYAMNQAHANGYKQREERG